MTQEINQDAVATDTPVGVETPATDTPTAEAKPAPKPRLPKLTLTHDGVEQPLLKYPFPVKAAKFSVKINGELAEAATTAGRGKAYTYLLYKNTSFYVPGVIPADADLKVNFPEDYKFDEAVIARVSNYKPKKPKAPKPEGEAAAEGTGEAQPAGEAQAEQTPEQAAVADAPKAKRRGR